LFWDSGIGENSTFLALFFPQTAQTCSFPSPLIASQLDRARSIMLTCKEREQQVEANEVVREGKEATGRRGGEEVRRVHHDGQSSDSLRVFHIEARGRVA